MRLALISSGLIFVMAGCSSSTTSTDYESEQAPGEHQVANLPADDIADRGGARVLDNIEVDLADLGHAEEAPPVDLPLAPDTPTAPQLPECLDITGATGCAALPAPPEFSNWECPEQWRAVSVSEATGHTYCEPRAEQACPEGDWAQNVVGENFIYVHPAGANTSTPADGLSPASAVPTIEMGLQLAEEYRQQGTLDADAVLVAKGEYDEVLYLSGDERVVGACPAQTRLVPNLSLSGSFSPAVWMTHGGSISFENFSIHGDSAGIVIAGVSNAKVKNVELHGQGIVVDDFYAWNLVNQPNFMAPTDALLEEIVIRDANEWYAGIDVLGEESSVVARNIYIDGVQPSTFSTLVHGIAVTYGSLDLEQAYIRGGDAGIYSYGANVTVARAVFTEHADTMQGQEGGSMVLNEIYSDASAGLAVFSGVDLNVQDAYFETGLDGVYIDESDASLERVKVDGAAYGVTVFGAPAAVSLVDIEVSHADIVGLGFLRGAVVDAQRVRVVDSFNLGVEVIHPGTVLTASDLRIENIQPLQNASYHPSLAPYLGWFGYALFVFDGARFVGERVTCSENYDVGLMVLGQDARASVSDLLITDTLSSPGQQAGYSLFAADGAEVMIDRGKMTRSARDAVHAADANVQLSDVILDETGNGLDFSEPEMTGEEIQIFQGTGRAITAVGGSHILAERVRLARTRDAGVWLSGSDTMGIFSDLDIQDVQSGGLAESGQGLVAADGASVRVMRAKIIRTRDAGVWLQGEATRGLISHISIHDSQKDFVTGKRGNGIHVTGKAQLEVSVGKIKHSEGSGVMVMGEQSRVSMEDMLIVGRRDLEDGSVEELEEIESVESLESVESVESEEDGLAVVHGGFASITRGVIMNHGRAGILISDDETLGLGSAAELQEVEVVENGIGICVNSETFSVENSFNEVNNDNNEVNSSVEEVEVQPQGSVETSMSSVEITAAQTAREF